MKRTVKEVAEAVHARVLGDPQVELSGVANVQTAAGGDLVFVEEASGLDGALNSPAAAIIVGESPLKSTASKPLLVAEHPRLAFALAARLFGAGEEVRPGIHATAALHPSARVHVTATIEAKAVIGEDAEIGARTRIAPGCVVGAKCSIGEDCTIYPNVTVYPEVRIGHRVVIHAGAVLGSDGFGYVRDKATGKHEKFPQIGRLEIEDDVEIGANSTIDRGALETTRIGRGTKIDNLVHIGHNCQIGEDVIIAAQTGLSGSVVLERDVVLGGQVGIGERARLQEGVMLGGQGGVLPKKVLRGKGVAFWGTPATPLREYLKQLATLARLAKKE